MFIPGVIFLLTSTTLANPVFEIIADDNNEDEYAGYRLPSHQNPSNYNLIITLNKELFDGTNVQFNGTIEITFSVDKEVDYVQLHAPMQIDEIEITPGDLKVTETTLNATTSILTILLSDFLSANIDYTMKIAYTNNIEEKSMLGLYRSSYVDEDDVTHYLLTTQFEPVHARQAFPCFDEPSYKATFTISLLYPKDQGLNAIGNTPIDGKPIIENDYERVIFEETPKMSTYLIAFIVSKYTCTQSQKIEQSLQHLICSRPESETTRILASDYSTKILEALGTFMDIKYSTMLVKKMTQAAIPDFNAGAMENWGLVTYRESSLLYDRDESSDMYKQGILLTIAHEFTHQWFGDYVTCDWWDNIFLNEGFATYFEFFILSRMDNLLTMETDKQFITGTQQLALQEDGTGNYKEITAKASSPAEIAAKFDIIAYNKAGSIIRMIENIITTEKFQTAMHNYLQSNAFSTASPKDLLSALEEQAPVSNLPSGITFSEVMDNWFNKPGYPLVTVSYDGENVVLKQDKFLYLGADSTTKWNIPITYTLSTDEIKFENVVPTDWLTTSSLTIPSLLKDNKAWIILNNQESAYYRVNYNKDLWDRIAAALMNNHTEIHVLNRAQIADDCLSIARAGLLKYSEAITILKYLTKEMDYYPWSSALNGLIFLVDKAGEDSELGVMIKNKILELMEGVYKTMSFGNDNSEHIYIIKRNLILRNACRFGHADCSSNSVSLFQSWKNNGIKVDRNLKSVVYCNGLRYSNNPEEDWNFLWEKHNSTKLSSELDLIEEALGCAKNMNILKKYLDLSLDESSGIRNQNIQSIWNGIVLRNSWGLQAVLEYLAEKHEKIRLSYPEVPSLLGTIANKISNSEQLEQFKQIIQSDGIDESYKAIGQKLIASTILNLGWLESNKDDLTNFLSDYQASKSPRLVTLSPIFLITFTSLKLFI
ncbi:glutamyl aminopeptidase-like [Diorhabda carinulata]|uniref:glutamyl aminopeptidase-like n=1 Tax=Diorhabda carinulata TaxID=1163345 RepID=UPI0025A018A7|nr:glutamyl aminopeptidase-like [Diorhabda carinulata]